MILIDLLFYPHTLPNVKESIHPCYIRNLCNLYIIYIDDTIFIIYTILIKMQK